MNESSRISDPDELDQGPAATFRKMSRVPAVITNGDVAALGMARSLKREGVPVVLVDSDPAKPGLHSRLVQPHLLSAISGPPWVRELLQLRARFDVRPILFLRTDDQVRTAVQHRREIEDAYRIRLPRTSCVDELLNKEGFQRAAVQHGFPVPKSLCIRSEQDVAELGQIQFPAVIKPCDTTFLSAGATKAQFIGSREEAAAACRATLQKAPALIVQEWIEGSDSDIYFCLQYRGEDGGTVSSFTGRKLRCWPVRTGDTASCIAAPEHQQELELFTTSFFDKTGFTGMGSLEFKRDRRNGRFVFIEATVGRTDWQEEVATLNGVNIPLAAYRYELGLPPPVNLTPGKPVIWSFPPSDLRSAWVGRTLFGSRPAGAKVSNACWRLNDPVPLMYFCMELFRKFRRKRARENALAETGQDMAA